MPSSCCTSSPWNPQASTSDMDSLSWRPDTTCRHVSAGNVRALNKRKHETTVSSELQHCDKRHQSLVDNSHNLSRGYAKREYMPWYAEGAIWSEICPNRVYSLQSGSGIDLKKSYGNQFSFQGREPGNDCGTELLKQMFILARTELLRTSLDRLGVYKPKNYVTNLS